MAQNTSTSTATATLAYAKVVDAAAAAAALNSFTNMAAVEAAINWSYSGAQLPGYNWAELAAETRRAHRAAEAASAPLFVARWSIGGRCVRGAEPLGTIFDEISPFQVYDLEKEFEEVVFTSATSVSGLRVTPFLEFGETGKVLLEYLPGSDPEYRGCYYATWEEVEQIPIYTSQSAGYAD